MVTVLPRPSPFAISMVKVVPPTDKVMESADGSITVGPEKLYVTLWGFAAASPLVRLAKGACSRIAAMRFFSIKSFEMLLSLPVVTSAEKVTEALLVGSVNA